MRLPLPTIPERRPVPESLRTLHAALFTLALSPHATIAQPSVELPADRAMARGDFSVALLWTAAARKENPTIASSAGRRAGTENVRS